MERTGLSHKWSDHEFKSSNWNIFNFTTVWMSICSTSSNGCECEWIPSAHPFCNGNLRRSDWMISSFLNKHFEHSFHFFMSEVCNPHQYIHYLFNHHQFPVWSPSLSVHLTLWPLPAHSIFSETSGNKIIFAWMGLKIKFWQKSEILTSFVPHWDVALRWGITT
jgi:hypothetical protein